MKAVNTPGPTVTNVIKFVECCTGTEIFFRGTLPVVDGTVYSYEGALPFPGTGGNLIKDTCYTLFNIYVNPPAYPIAPAMAVLSLISNCNDLKCPVCGPIPELPCFMLIPCDGAEPFVSNNVDFGPLLNTFVSVASTLYTGTVYVVLLTDNTCSEAITVTITTVPVDTCPLTCYYIQNSNGVLYVDSDDVLQEISSINAKPYVKICSKVYPVVDTSSLDYIIVNLGLCDLNGCPQQCYKLVNCENGTIIYTNSDSVLPYLYGTNTFVKVLGQEGCWEVLPLSEGELCDCPRDVVITSSYVDCITCTGYTSYKLTNCNGIDVIYTLDDLSIYLNSTIKIHCGCYTIEQLTILPPNPQSITVDFTFDTCIECLRSYWKLTDCLGEAEDVYTYTDLSTYVDKVIKIEGCETCWEIEPTEFPINPTTVNVIFDFDDCPTCAVDIPCLCQTARLINPCVYYECTIPGLTAVTLVYTDCLNVVHTIVFEPDKDPRYVSFCGPQNQELSVGYVIREDLNCNILSWIDCDGNVVYGNRGGVAPYEISPKTCVKKWLMPEGQYEYTVYGECKYGLCPPPIFENNRTVRPGYNTPGCNPERYDEITCHFADIMYKIVLEKRYGITNCCPDDDEKWLVQKELIDLQVVKDPNYIFNLNRVVLPVVVENFISCVPLPPPPCPTPPPLVSYNCVETPTCVQYLCLVETGVFNFIGGGTLFYKNCEGIEEQRSWPTGKFSISISICSIPNATSNDIYAIGDNFIFTFSQTPIICESTIDCVQVQGTRGTYQTLLECETNCSAAVQVPCEDCIKINAITASGDPFELIIAPTGTYTNGTFYYYFTIEGVDYEIYNETWDTTDPPGSWLLYSYEGGDDIGAYKVIGTCPIGTYEVNPDYFQSFVISYCGGEPTGFVLYSVFQNPDGLSGVGFTYLDCNDVAIFYSIPAAREVINVFVCSTPGRVLGDFVQNGGISFSVTETVIPCNC